jgi:hypothetical protein
MVQHDGDLLQITPIFGYADVADRFVNVWTVRLQSVVDVSDATMVVRIGSWLEDVYEDMLPMLALGYDFVEWDWRNLTQDLIYPAESWPTFVNGSATGDLLPSNLCSYMFARTVFSKVYGRKYFNGLTEAHNLEGGTPDSALVSAMASAAVIGYGLHLLEAGVYFQGGVQTTAHGFTLVSEIRVQAVWRALRRRILGVGG